MRTFFKHFNISLCMLINTLLKIGMKVGSQIIVINRKKIPISYLGKNQDCNARVPRSPQHNQLHRRPVEDYCIFWFCSYYHHHTMLNMQTRNTNHPNHHLLQWTIWLFNLIIILENFIFWNSHPLKFKLKSVWFYIFIWLFFLF